MQIEGAFSALPTVKDWILGLFVYQGGVPANFCQPKTRLTIINKYATHSSNHTFVMNYILLKTV
jgi:hypothetical protein